MEKFASLEIVVSSNGITRIYGNGGLVYEIQSDYVQVKTLVDAFAGAPSGLVKQKPEAK